MRPFSASEERQGQARLTHLLLRNFGRRRCWYALISTKPSLPKCRVSERASINCLLNSLLPWFSSAFQSVCVSHSGLIFHREACAFCMNQLLFPTDQLFKSMDRLSFFFAALLAWMEIWGWLDELWRESLQADTFGWGLLYKKGAAMKERHHCPNSLLTLRWGSRNTW